MLIGGMPHPAGQKDPLFSNVKLLLGFDANNAVDESGRGNNFTTYAFAQPTTTIKKFGTHSLYTQGTGTSADRTSTLDFDIPVSTPFCIEMWFYRLTGGGTEQALFSNGYVNPTPGYQLRYNQTNGQLVFVYFQAGGTSVGYFSDTINLAANTWHHVGIERDSSNVIRFLHNGSTSGAVTNGAASQVTTAKDSIGGTADGSRSLTGYLDEVRITVGAHRYGGTYAVPTSAFPRS